MKEPQKPYRMTHRNAVTGEIISVIEYPENAPILPALTANERGAGNTKVSAWSYEIATSLDSDNQYTGWRKELSQYKPHVPDGSIRNLVPLYSKAEIAAAVQAAREDERMKAAAHFLKSLKEKDVEREAAVQAEREALLRDIPTTDGLMPDEVGGFLKGLLAYQLAIRARGTTDAVERVEAGVRDVDSSREADLVEALDGIVHFADGFVFYHRDGPAGTALRQWIEGARRLLPTPASAETK